MNTRLDNGVIAAHQQCHFSPDHFRDCTVIGPEGRPESSGDRPGDMVKVWDIGPTAYRDDCDIAYEAPEALGTHGGAGRHIIAEFRRFGRAGRPAPPPWPPG
ncbi:hypothetical protein [Streptosporangium minutum]|uniref:Uncharacterized protein n=1 Tax=Streptosporangium minutum TaxID=569862 RepID=A0A243RLE5_9ACTN|nr:hypothetical protein [Streptosporangium minutum]OUC95721.1 hypothetical protein CA984_17650 [Streptosporangium minutum]